MVRMIDPLTLIIWGVVLVAAVVALLASRKWKRVRQWTTAPFANRRRQLCLAILVVLVTGVYFLVFRAQDAGAKESVLIKIDAKGKPIAGAAKFHGRPAEPGTYMVRLGKRYFILHLPKGYRDNGQTPLPVLLLLHGAHQEDPLEWALVDCQMNQYSDRDKFICVYPAAQALYTVKWQKCHSWNSKLGTLSDFNDKFEDDAQFLKQVCRWVLENTSADPNNFNLGGFSEGALMAQDVAQSGEIAKINCLILCAGTMLEGQQNRRLNGNGPRHVFIQLNAVDTVLPYNPDDVEAVVEGKSHFRNTWFLGFVNLAKSKPGLQEPYWLNEALAGGGKSEHAKEETEVYRRDTYLIRHVGERINDVTVYRVQGDHAWHGSPEGGDAEEGIVPRLDFPLGELIAQYILAHKVLPADR